MNLQSLMIRASAGSGKTYQLANRFLALLAIGVAPSRIIALTFTRKAAGEFADRILHRLAEGASGEAAASVLAGQIATTLRGDPSTGQPGMLPAGTDLPALHAGDFLRLLENLIGSMDRLALGTFDSFFTRIARTSCYELGLGGFALLDEADLRAEKDRTFTRIFSRLGTSATHRNDFLHAFKLATLGREEARFVRMLDDFIDAHHLRYLAQPEANAWGGEDWLWPHGAPWPVTSDFAGLSAQLRAASDGVAWGHGSWVKGWDQMLDWFDVYQPGQAGKEPAMLTRLLGNLRGLADGSADFSFYKATIKVPEPAASLAAALIGGFIVAEIRLCLQQTRGIHAVMERYEALYGRDVRQRGKLGFADLTMVLALADIGGSGHGQNIGYRLDQWFDHWMLDEFQDTNRPQWNVLSGLVQEVQQDEEGKRTFFVVGDPKQGVHAWRGGEPRLFGEIARDWHGRLPEWSMEKSWRSCAAVLDLVNQVCDPGQAWMRDRFPSAALDRWLFAPHAAGRKNTRGESLVLEVPAPESPSEDDDPAKPTWPAIAAILRDYQPLARGLSCAVLVTSNANARAIADFLRHKIPGVPIEVDSETPMAADGPVGAALFDLFRWLHAPADGLAQGHVLHCPMHAALALALENGNPFSQWEAARSIIAARGIAGFLDRLAPAIRSVHGLDAFNALRLDAWLLKARQFDTTGGTTADWLRQLESWKLREFSRAGAIQIMTVHKSKGLEFDLVILPDLAGKAFDDTGRRDLLVARQPDGRNSFLCLSPRKTIVEADPVLRQLSEEWCADQCYERFCNLYVAMTRAKHGLFLLVPAPKPGKSSGPGAMKRNYEDWVRDAVAAAPPPARDFAPDGLVLRPLWASGEAGWLNEFPVQPIAAPQPAPMRLPPPLPRLRRRTPSGEKTDATRKAVNARGDRRAAMDFGSSVHAAFEAIAWIDDGPPPPAPSPDIQGLLDRCFAAPALRDLFTRPAGTVDLWREQPFDIVVDGEWTSGVIDRLHVHRENGRATRAVIIDFKTDHVEKLEELVPRYEKQMQSYRSAMARILQLEPAAVSCVLVSTCLAGRIELAAT